MALLVVIMVLGALWCFFVAAKPDVGFFLEQGWKCGDAEPSDRSPMDFRRQREVFTLTKRGRALLSLTGSRERAGFRPQARFAGWFSTGRVRPEPVVGGARQPSV